VEGVQKQVAIREPGPILGFHPALSVPVLENFGEQKLRAVSILGLISTFPSRLLLLLVL
jgi:hypothetical protein